MEEETQLLIFQLLDDERVVRGGDLAPDYLRFMERRLRETFDFVGTPVRVVARKRKRRET